jgi:hypothetical protein
MVYASDIVVLGVQPGKNAFAFSVNDPSTKIGWLNTGDVTEGSLPSTV